MKILVATTMFPNKYNPFSGVFIKNHLELMKTKFGIESIVITGDGSNQSKLLILKKYLLFFCRMLWSLLFKNFDLIHVHFSYPTGFLSIIGKWITKKKIIITTHGSDINQHKKRNFLSRYLNKLALEGCNHIIAVSDDLKRKIISQFSISAEKISVIDMGFNTQIFRYSQDNNNQFDNPFIMLFVGRLIPAKGFELLIDAIEKLHLQANSKFECVVIGEGSHRTQYEKTTKEKRLDMIFRFIEPLGQKEIATWMRKSNIVVIPSYQEGFGLVAIESLACGTPVIASKIGGLKEIIQDGINGYFITPGRVDELEEKINLVMDNPNMIPSEVCVESISQFDAELKVEQIKDLYTTIIAS
tara:strand:- start:2719 stop:3789 length:1071 start_codon:yes stop_codon:yes gene_type:complete